MTGSKQDADDWHAQKVDREAVTASIYDSPNKTKTMISQTDFIDTSAAAKPTATEAEALREQCFNLLQGGSYTADEVATMLRKSILSIRPRIAELHRKGWIFDSGKRRKNASGHGAIVWTTLKPFTLS